MFMKAQSLTFITFALAVGLFLSVGAQGKSQTRVIVITDDQGYGDLGCTGNPVIKTPHVDKLANESVWLDDYHVAPTCSPTRAALMSGHWTNRTGVWHTIMGRSMIRANEGTLGQFFRENGYETGMFGKWHLGDNYPYRPEDRGFSEVYRHGGGAWGKPRTLGTTPTSTGDTFTTKGSYGPRVSAPTPSSKRGTNSSVDA